MTLKELGKCMKKEKQNEEEIARNTTPWLQQTALVKVKSLMGSGKNKVRPHS